MLTRLLSVCALLTCILSHVSTHLTETWCKEAETDCHFVLVVDYELTMMWNRDLVKSDKGRLYKYDVNISQDASQLPMSEVITADGFYEPRLVMTFNGSIPGPALHVYRGQRVHVRVINKMMHESTSVHFHGVRQCGTPHSDGVPYITQCPILPGQSFDQRFVVDQTGSYFYHSHSGPQMTNGLYGPLVIHPRSTTDPTMTNDSPGPGPDVDVADEFVLMFQDWNHDWDSNLVTMKMRWGIYSRGKKYQSTKTHAGVRYSGFVFHSGLVNGRGRFYDNDGHHNDAPLSIFTVQQGKRYKLRLMNPSDIYPFRVSVDDHPLLVVSSDGEDLEPVLVESVIVHPGERFDVIIDCNQTRANYWIRGQTLEVDHTHVAEAILHYIGAPENSEPKSSRQSCSGLDPCPVLNCPFLYYPAAANTKCINFDQIRAPRVNTLKPSSSNNLVEFFLNFAFPGHTETPGSVNGRTFVFPPAPFLSQPQDAHAPCSRDQCGDEKICHCPHIISYSRDDLVQLVLVNMGAGRGWDHPIHIHGHSFQVVKIGYPTYDKPSGRFVKENQDINCGQGEMGTESFCNNARWADQTWTSGNIPGLELARAPAKDTIVVPSGGYVVVRFKADNPGAWLIHCHLELHMTDGMIAMLNESFASWPVPPTNFPKCNSFQYDTSYIERLQKNGPR